MTDLERRYQHLVRLFYPAGYRRERGTEIVGTYLALAAPDRRWPSAADVSDLAGGGVRERLRAAGATGLTAGIRLAGTLALITTTILAVGGLVLEVTPPPPVSGIPRLGPFASLGIVVWAAWALAAIVHLAAPGRWTRTAIGSALVLTAAVVPLAAITGTVRPPLLMLLPQLALGLVALGAPARSPVTLRALPLVGAAVALPVAVRYLLQADFFAYYYGWNPLQALAVIGVLLLAVATLLALGLALRNDFRGAWALLVLLGPIGLLSLRPLAGALLGSPNHTWRSLAAAAVGVALIAVALPPLALATRNRIAARRHDTHRCASCGTPTG